MVQNYQEYFKCKQELGLLAAEPEADETSLQKAALQPEAAEAPLQKEVVQPEAADSSTMLPPQGGSLRGAQPEENASESSPAAVDTSSESTDPSESNRAGRPSEVNRAQKPKCRGMVHVVQEGDTLYKIAQKNRLRVLDLLLANPYVNVYNLQIGDEICVPVKGIPVVDKTPYKIQEGDTIDSILKAHNLTFEELARYNPFLLELPLPVNTVLFLPASRS